jgi:multiple sugar transport system substrate-binding protein
MAVSAALVLSACGGGGQSAGGPAKLQFWAYNEPSGSFRTAAENCSKSSNGAYNISFQPLANDADTQRQSLVRRLAAKDSSIDIMSMDVVWTSEFAEAGWVAQWPANLAKQIKDESLSGPYATATYKNKLFAAPANSNTQLLWYRKSLVKGAPPKTWDQLIDTASKMKKGGRIEIQGAAYEGMMVWFNALVASAGGEILKGPQQADPSAAWTTAANIIAKLADSKAADPSLSSQKEDQNRIAFESGSAAFQVNYPFIYPSAASVSKKFQNDIGWAPYPAVVNGKPVKAPIGGFNFGVGAYSKHKQQAFAAAQCLRNAKNQKIAAAGGGLPPTISKVYADKKFQKDYPFADLIKKQIENGGVRPQTPAYADLSLAVATTLSPPGRIKGEAARKELTDKIGKALKSEGLL